MRSLVLALLLVLASSTARAETLGIGLFVGEPTGFDLKVGLGRRSALDIVLGRSSFREGRTDYAHLTYLYTPFVARGSSVLVPLRFGIGVAALGVIDDNAHIAGRVPFEIGFRFRGTPLEIYGEIALVMVFDDNTDVDADGGIGIRFYF